MRDVVVFNGLNALDFQEIRQNVIRIPEVILRVREAQKVWTSIDTSDFELVNYIAADDRIFLSNIKLKSLASAIVQVGLFDRYLKRNSRPEFLVGGVKSDSPLQVAAGLMGFEELIAHSPVFQSVRPTSVLQIASDPVLSGMTLSEYAIFQMQTTDKVQGYVEIEERMMDMNRVVQRLVETFEIKKIVNVGPGNLLVRKLQPEMELSEVQVLESIDLDPMLSWFWPQFRESSLALAQ